jgi:hypothetical protein
MVEYIVEFISISFTFSIVVVNGSMMRKIEIMLM